MSESVSRVLRDVFITMRDGVRLCADVYLPDGDGPWPALVERTPYNKDGSPEVQVGSPSFFPAHGYAVVIQDVRGRFKSEGDFVPFYDDGWGERRDGYDTVAWIAAQPWCDGNVGGIGGSYAGATQYRMAPTRPPHLRALYSRESSADYWHEWVYHGGALELGFMLPWTLRQAANNLPRPADDPESARRKALIEAALADVDALYRRLPLAPEPLAEGVADWYNDYLRHPAYGPFWRQWSLATQYGEVDTPCVHMGGWFDIFVNGTIKNYVGMRARARTPEARAGQRLIIGPWIHGPWNMATSVQGEVDFGPESIRAYNEIRRPWFDHWLKGIDSGVQHEPPVQVFVMGENRWRAAADFPLPDTRYTSWFLRAGGGLSLDTPVVGEGSDSFDYDPADPTPTVGGGTLSLPGGAFDQRPAEGHGLVYTSEPLTHDLTIIGPVRAVLHASSSAPDTDWVVRLTDVHPDGTSRLLCDGILRARYRDSWENPTWLTPGQVYEFNVDLWATANTFKAGHRIRVAVASSNFPRFDRNLNVAAPVAEAAEGQVAHNTVYHEAARGAHVVLPVIGEERLETRDWG